MNPASEPDTSPTITDKVAATVEVYLSMNLISAMTFFLVPAVPSTVGVVGLQSSTIIVPKACGSINGAGRDFQRSVSSVNYGRRVIAIKV